MKIINFLDGTLKRIANIIYFFGLICKGIFSIIVVLIFHKEESW